MAGMEWQAEARRESGAGSGMAREAMTGGSERTAGDDRVLLQTKLFDPLPRTAVLPRLCLALDWEAVFRLPVTRVSALAGSGKTMRLAGWAARSSFPMARKTD